MPKRLFESQNVRLIVQQMQPIVVSISGQRIEGGMYCESGEPQHVQRLIYAGQRQIVFHVNL